jgi:hypothetical protein
MLTVGPVSWPGNRLFRRAGGSPELQELVAPALVGFFSKEGEYLGNKRSLERHIHEVTGIVHDSVRILSNASRREALVDGKGFLD